jgi:hypothetical protein
MLYENKDSNKKRDNDNDAKTNEIEEALENASDSRNRIKKRG